MAGGAGEFSTMPCSGMCGVVERRDLVLVALGALFLGEVEQVLGLHRVDGSHGWGNTDLPFLGRLLSVFQGLWLILGGSQ